MAAIKIVLRKKQKADGTYPLAIRITKDRKSSYIFLGYSVKETEWDAKQNCVKRSHPNSKRLNNLLIQRLSEISNASIELETDTPRATIAQLRNSVNSSVGVTFFAQAEAYLELLKAAGKYNQYTSERSRLKYFKNFLKSDPDFRDIAPGLLEKFRAHCISNQQLSERSAVNNLVTIRSVFSHAIAENIVDSKYYPFGKGKMKIKFPESTKIGLTNLEVKRLEDLDLPNTAHDHARNLWLLSFYFAGMRISDVLRLKWADMSEGRLSYSMGKNNKFGSFKIAEKAQLILDKYSLFKENKSGLVFPDLQDCDAADKFNTQRQIAFRTSAIDKCLRNHVAPLARIDKPLTMHIARHTFGNLAGDKIPIQMLQKLYRHSSITTTIGYQQNFITKDSDAALEKVLSLQ